MVSQNGAVQAVKPKELEAEAAEKRKEEAKQALYKQEYKTVSRPKFSVN